MRECNICKCQMKSGYIVDDTAYYCGNACLDHDYSPSEYEEMYDNDIAYWTEWE